MEYHSPGQVSQPYMELFQFLLMPVLWDRPANIKPLVRLIQAYIRIGPAQVSKYVLQISKDFDSLQFPTKYYQTQMFIVIFRKMIDIEK